MYYKCYGYNACQCTKLATMDASDDIHGLNKFILIKHDSLLDAFCGPPLAKF